MKAILTLLMAAILFSFTIPSSPRLSGLPTKTRIPVVKGETKQLKMGFKNNGESPLLIQNIKTSCDCLKASFSKEEIQTAETSYIILTYDSKSEPLGLNKIDVEIESNSKPKATFTVQGDVRNKF